MSDINLINKIHSKYQQFSKTEQKIANFILNNWEDVYNSSIKELAQRNDTSPSTISRFFQKIGLSGFKDLRMELSKINLEYLNKLSPWALLYKETLLEDLLYTINELRVNEIEEIVELIRNNSPVTIFATGHSSMLAQFFYFSLEAMDFRADLITSLYDFKALDVNNKILFIISMSGTNAKVIRYLNLVKNKNPLKIIGISSTNSFNNKELLDHHFWGYISTVTNINTRAIPLNEKYVIQLILDIFLLKIHHKDPSNINSFINKIKTVSS